MKIVFIGQKCVPAKYGGVEVHVEEIGKRLVYSKHEVDVYCNYKYMKYRKSNYCGVNLIAVHSTGERYTDTVIYTFLSTLLCLCKKNYDIIHYHSIVPSFFSIIPVIFGKKVIVTVHSLQWHEKKWNFLIKYLIKIFTRLIICLPKKIIVVSKTLQKYFEKRYNMVTVYIPNGVLVPEVLSDCSEIDKKYGLKRNSYILWMGRITHEKRIEWLIDVFNVLKNYELKDKKLVIAGHLLEKKHLANKKEIDNKRIIFTGFVSGNIKRELLSNAYLYVHPSYTEGLPISILEAMSYGNVCLASDIPPIKEIITDGYDGLLFNFKSIESLKNKIGEYTVMGEEKRSSIKRNAVKRIVEEYNINDVVNKIEKIYKDIYYGKD